jgi:hypothetical protein
MSEKYLWYNSKHERLPSIAFLDQWQNYSIRFSGNGQNEKLKYLPDFINCINDVGEREMVQEGFDPNVLVKFGHPYLSSLTRDDELIEIQLIKKKLGINVGEKVYLFASEAIKEHFGHSRGYDQYDAIKVFFEIVAKSDNLIRPLIKLHPKELSHGLVELLRKFKDLNPLVVSNEFSSLECIKLADQIYGMTSIMLIESFVLGKPTFSIQPHLKGLDLLILSRLGHIHRISNNVNWSESRFQCGFEEQNNNFEFDFKVDIFKSFLANQLLGR